MSLGSLPAMLGLPSSLSSPIPLEILAISTLLLAAYVLYNLFFSPLSKLPGPLSARTGVGSWLTRRALKWDFGWKLLEQHDALGPVVRTGRNTVSVCDTTAINELYNFKQSAPQKAPFYTYFAAVPGTMMSTLPNRLHGEKRKAQSPAFTMNVLVQLEEFVDSCLDSCLALLDRHSTHKDPSTGNATIEMAEVMQLLALDTIGELAFGKSFNLCEKGRDEQGFLQDLLAFNIGACLAGTQPIIGRLLRMYPGWLLGARGGTVGERARACVQERVKQLSERSQGEEIRHDILSKLFVARHADGRPYTVGEVSISAGSILGAGSDTTAITMRSVFRYIIGDSRIYAKVMQEIDEAVESGALQFPITYADATKLEYFQACLKETLRYHPAIPWSLPRTVPAGGAHIAGHFFPAGTEVAMSPFVWHRQTAAFGEDARVFRPERWIEADVAQRRDMEHNLITFGSGSRVCIGRNIAIMEVSKVVPTLLHKYKFSFTPRNTTTSPHKQSGRSVDGIESDSEPWHVVSHWFSHQSDFWVDFEPREV